MGATATIAGALAGSALECAVLAALLLAWADRVAGSRPLALFLAGVAAWCVGLLLPATVGAGWESVSRILLGAAPAASSAFLVFALAFVAHPVGRRTYGALAAATALAVAVDWAAPGITFLLVPGFGPLAVPTAVGWSTAGLALVLALAGHAVLLRAVGRARGTKRRQIAAVLASSALGLASVAGLAPSAFGIPVPPWTLAVLPLHPLVLVYGILRYRVMASNAWARRAIAWALLTAVAVAAAGLAGAAAPTLAGGGPLAGGLAAAAVLALAGPIRRLAERCVYPGQVVMASDLAAWRNAMAGVSTHAALAETAARLLRDRLGTEVAIEFGGLSASGPSLVCTPGSNEWSCAAEGWGAAPPGVRRIVEIFADMLASEAGRVAAVAARLSEERDRAARERFAELGAIAAAVAHDVRGPLNNIRMAVATAPTDLREDVTAEVYRLSSMADDLLAYVRPWKAGDDEVDLWEVAAEAARGRPGIEVPPRPVAPVVMRADAGLVARAVGNVIDNASLLAGRSGFEAAMEGGAAVLRVWDDGPGIPEGLRERVFEPFVSRRSGGTGLGLAIVARIMAAHGGLARVEDRPGWSTCVILSFPARP